MYYIYKFDLISQEARLINDLISDVYICNIDFMFATYT